jgi:hypothetical protein
MRFVFLSIILIFSVISILPQEKKYFDSPFGGGGGFTPGWTFPNVEPLNERFSWASDVAADGMFTSGGAGFIYIGFVPGLRVGGMGFGGATSESSLNPEDGYNYEAEYSMGGGGLTVEYTLPMVKDFGISFGLVLGGGGIQIDLYKNKGGADWNTLGSPDGNEFHYTMNNNYWHVSPTLNIDIPFYRFLNFRIGGGYQLSFAENWEIDNGQDIQNVPTDLNGKTFYIQAGLFAGFFSF